MISFIICSAKNNLEGLLLNIEQSAGVEHEIIIIPNSGAKYTIAQAYNTGLKNTKYPFVCFIHDDVKILSKDWGEKLIAEWNSLESPGLMGVIGTQYKSVFPTPWTCPEAELNKGQIWQYLKHTKGNGFLLQYSSEILPVEVAVVDGVFLFSTKSFLTNVGAFDENLKGFHCYDIELALRINSTGNKVYVSPSVLLEHYSEGKLNNDWFENQLYLVKKWKASLPLYNNKIRSIQYGLEVKCFKRSIYVFFKNRISFKLRVKYILFYIFFNNLPAREYYNLILKNIYNLFSGSTKSEV